MTLSRRLRRAPLELALRIPGVRYEDYQGWGLNSPAHRLHRLAGGLASIADGLVAIASTVLPIDSAYSFEHTFSDLSETRPFMRFGATPKDLS